MGWLGKDDSDKLVKYPHIRSDGKVSSFHSIHQQFCHLPPQDIHLNSSMNSPSLLRQLLLLNFCVINNLYKFISHFLLFFQLKDLSGSDLLENELFTDMSLELDSFFKIWVHHKIQYWKTRQAIERYFTSSDYQSSKIVLLFSPFLYLCFSVLFEHLKSLHPPRILCSSNFFFFISLLSHHTQCYIQPKISGCLFQKCQCALASCCTGFHIRIKKLEWSLLKIVK